jgi:hypothetical protein
MERKRRKQKTTVRRRTRAFVATVFVVFGVVACEAPTPIELNVAHDGAEAGEIDVKTFSPESDEEAYAYAAEFDSTGVTAPPPEGDVVFMLRGMTYAWSGGSIESRAVAARFLDRSKPVFGVGGKRIGYRSVSVPNVRFDRVKANLDEFRLSLLTSAGKRDTVVGPQYRRYYLSDLGFYAREHVLSFSPRRSNDVVEISARALEKMRAGVAPVLDDRGRPTYRLEWDPAQYGALEPPQPATGETEWIENYADSITVVVGAHDATKNRTRALYLFRLKDDGEAILPAGLFVGLPYERFTHLSVTFVREVIGRWTDDEKTGSIVVISQSVRAVLAEPIR